MQNKTEEAVRKYKLTKDETETHISFTKADTKAIVYTNMKDWMKRLDVYCEEFPESYGTIRTDEYSKTYEVPIRNVRISKPRRISREEKEIRSQRMKKARISLKKTDKA